VKVKVKVEVEGLRLGLLKLEYYGKIRIKLNQIIVC
jgi:hypothetical protein